MDKNPKGIEVSLHVDGSVSVVSQPSMLLEGKEYDGDGTGGEGEGEGEGEEEEEEGEEEKEEKEEKEEEEEKEEKEEKREEKKEENKTNKQKRPPPQTKRKTKWKPLLKLDVKHTRPLPSFPHPYLLVLFTSAEISRVCLLIHHHP